jgi:hypothetical protein
MWAARIMILDGTQPTLTQVPPMVPRSISVTCAPCSTAFSAAAIAAPPLPMTTCNGRSLPLGLSAPIQPHLVEQAGAVVRRWRIGKRCLVAQSGHGGSQRIR